MAVVTSTRCRCRHRCRYGLLEKWKQSQLKRLSHYSTLCASILAEYALFGERAGSCVVLVLVVSALFTARLSNENILHLQENDINNA